MPNAKRLDRGEAASRHADARAVAHDLNEPRRREVVAGTDVDVRNAKETRDDAADDRKRVVHNQVGPKAFDIPPDGLRVLAGKRHISEMLRPRVVVNARERVLGKEIDEMSAVLFDSGTEARVGEDVDAGAGSREISDEKRDPLEMAPVRHAEEGDRRATHPESYTAPPTNGGSVCHADRESTPGVDDLYLTIAKAAGRRDHRALVTALHELATSASGPAILATLPRHGLGLLVLNQLDTLTLRQIFADDIVATFERWRTVPRVTPRALLQHFHDLRHALDRDGVPVLLLKGFVFAERLYGGIDRRPQFDVDVLVRHGDVRRTGRWLRRRSFRQTGFDSHSRTFTKDGWKLDVHGSLRTAPAYAIDETAMWAEAVDLDLGGPCRTLSDEWHLVLLVLSAFEDLGQGMVKIKQLLDLYLLLTAMDATTDWDRFFARRRTENTMGIAIDILALVVALFHAERDVPSLVRALDARVGSGAVTTRLDALRLVFAERKAAPNLAWFARVYPGNMAVYLAHFWYGSFPGNVKTFRLGRFASSVAIAFRRRTIGRAAIAANRARR